jgi:type IV pilus assembly protein PilC
MMVLATGVTIFLLTYVMPKFMPLFRSRGIKLPTPTRVVMAVSDVLLQWWYLWLLGLVVAIVGLVVAKRTEAGRQCFDWLKINTPVLGPMFRKVILSRTIRTLGALLESGVPVLDALRLCSDVSANYYYQRVWDEVRQQVTEGKRICDVLAGNPLFPRVLVQMMSAGEETGRLDFVLQRVSVYYDHEVETAIKTTTSLIEPIMITVMGVVVGTIGLAVLLPIFSLSKQP